MKQVLTAQYVAWSGCRRILPLLLAVLFWQLPFASAQQDSHQQNLAPFDALCFYVDLFYDVSEPPLWKLRADLTADLERLAASLGVLYHVLDPLAYHQGEDVCPFEGGLIMRWSSDGFEDFGSVLARTDVEVFPESFAGLQRAIVWQVGFFVYTPTDRWPELIAGDIEKTIRRFEEDWRASHPVGE